MNDTAGSVAIGKRYSRLDELGIPFGITVDRQTFVDKTVTVRERDSMRQIRVSIEELPQILLDLSQGLQHWDQVAEKYGYI